MKIVDFSQSFLTFRIDTLKKPPRTVTHKPPFSLNNARIQLESVCRITDQRTGSLSRFVQGASCKTERVGVEREIWTEPNADFIPIFSEEGYLNLKTYARTGIDLPLYPPGSGTQQDRQTGILADTFDSTRIDLTEREGVELADVPAIVDAVFSGQVVIATTEYRHGHYHVRLDYPVKTINVNERDLIYQTDTGPHLFPDLSREPADLLAGFELAFSAFNTTDWIEFIIRTPTEIAPGIQVQHYSRTLRLEGVRNRLYRFA
ncbi:MAG: hypothetical protein U0903_06015 [Planctomycetales bacterium]